MSPTRTIPLCEPTLGEPEAQAAQQVVRSGWIGTGGPAIETFEQRVAACCNAPFAVATQSGTAALHLAMLDANLPIGSEIIAPALTFIAPINVIRYVQCVPLLVDVEPNHAQMDVPALEQKLARNTASHQGKLINKHTGRRISAILAVHLLGHAVDVEPLRELAQRYELKLIEDAAEALGVRYQDGPLFRGKATQCLSFNVNKIITTGGGGMVLCHDETTAARLKHLSLQAKRDPLRFVHDQLGYNYRMTNLAAAVGVAQLDRLDHHIAAKQKIQQRYREAFDDHPAMAMLEAPPGSHSTCWMPILMLDARHAARDAMGLLESLAESGIMTRPLWQAIVDSPAHAEHATRWDDGPHARRMANAGLALPCSAHLSIEDQRFVIEQVLRIMHT